VTNLITNHTYSNLVLRPPGLVAQGPPIDEPAYRALGERMTDHNLYANMPSYGLYDTSGTTEDWSYYSTGGFGFTFEIGPNEFHPPFESGVVDEYLGRGDAAGAGKGGNREAYYEMLESTADAGMHSLLTGQAPKGSTAAQRASGRRLRVGRHDAGERDLHRSRAGRVRAARDQLGLALHGHAGLERQRELPVPGAGRAGRQGGVEPHVHVALR
jgi:hypothetical protein